MRTITAPTGKRDAKGRMLPGTTLNSPGRLGKPNKAPAAIREMIHTALDRAGGADYLLECAQSKDTALRVAFIGLIKNVIPRAVEIEAGQTLEMLLEGAHKRRLEAETKPGTLEVLDAKVVDSKPKESTDGESPRKP